MVDKQFGAAGGRIVGFLCKGQLYYNHALTFAQERFTWSAFNRAKMTERCFFPLETVTVIKYN